MSDQYEEWYYDYIVETISSPQFRNPIKEFIDKNCESFIGIEENSFEQGKIFKEFTETKYKEWDSFRIYVSQWELDKYLERY